MRAGVLASLLLLPAAAVADDAKSAQTGGFSHWKQFELSVRVATGLRGIATYEKTTYCGERDMSTSTGLARVCTGRSPLTVDFELGYGIKRTLDLFLEIRIGLEQDFGATPGSTDGPHPFHLSPGVRIFFSDSSHIKLFTTGQLVLDFAGYENAAGESLGTDFGVRNMSGVWIDLDRAYGFYAFAGETATFARWLRFELEGGVGIQGRYR